MALDETTKEAELARLAAVLGLPDAGALAVLQLESLRRRTHRELLDLCRHLGLKGVAKLPKDKLAGRLGDAIAKLVIAVPAGSKASVENAEHAVVTHKFELGEHGEPLREEPRTIPWGYGEDRVTAMAVDPDRLFVYWETTDDAIANARRHLGPGGPDAWLNLRVYDTTGRLFDGTNAHGYFDHKIERHDRQWFFHIGKPSSEAFVDVGLRSHEGYFVKIARSGRVEFPRNQPIGWTDPEWMTVRSAGDVQSAGRGMTTAGAGATQSGAGAEAGEHSGFEPVPLWQMRVPWDELVRFGDNWAGGDRVEWEQHFSNGIWEGGHRTFMWEGPVSQSSWEAGPFSFPVEAPAPVEESWVGPARMVRVGEQTHVMYGPWQVVIRGLDAHRQAAVIARWEVYRTWVAGEGHEVRGMRMTSMHGMGSSELMGASERRWLSASEARLRGASELYFLGASEMRLGGASETLFAAASEWMMRGATERRFMGASEMRLGGASETLFRGASELALRGASEQLLGGASQWPTSGASEVRLSASENNYPPLPEPRG